MLNPLFNQLGEVFLLAAEVADDKGAPGGQGQRDRVNQRFDVTEWRAFRLHVDAVGRRGLAGG